MSKVVFISTTNIFDRSGNGGVMASREHYDMLKDIVGEQNIKVILFVHSCDHIDTSEYNKHSTVIYKRTEGTLRLLIAACFGCRIYLPWQEKEIKKEIESYYPDVVFLDFSIAGRLMRGHHKYRTMCFFHNVESDYTLNKMKTDGIWYLPAYFAAKANDRWALRADHIMCFNHRDSNRLLELHGRGADSILPISLKDRFVEKRCVPGDEKRLLFLGSCFGPNEDGIEWFIKEVMPHLEGITLDIVGLGFEEKREQYSVYPNVNVIGTVEDTDEYYYTHPIVIMPIRYGSGMKVKTAEAMMFGRTILATSEALEGYNVESVEGIYLCNTAEEFIRRIRHLWRGCFQTYNVDVREFFLQGYESKKMKCHFTKIMGRILDEYKV